MPARTCRREVWSGGPRRTVGLRRGAISLVGANAGTQESTERRKSERAEWSNDDGPSLVAHDSIASVDRSHERHDERTPEADLDLRISIRTHLLSAVELPGWVPYGFGLIEIAVGWPWSRWVGVVAIALGLFDHARGVTSAWRDPSMSPPA
jgi:hypothetical protein